MNYLNRIRSMYHHNVLIENLSITCKDLHCLSSFTPSQDKRGSIYGTHKVIPPAHLYHHWLYLT